MVKVTDVSNFLVSISKPEEEDGMTNLRVNKLLYFIQGCYLARTGKPLFEEDFEAWDLGPVIPEIYNLYKVCGRSVISKDSVNKDIELPKDAVLIIADVLREYGKYTPNALVNITHRSDTSWSKVYVKNQNRIISKDLIKQEFSNNKIKTTLESISAKESYSILPKEFYYPEEDKLWEE